MGTKYQDSTPQVKTWEVGAPNKPHAYYTWGYDTVLVTFKVPEGITGGKVAFEGYMGFKYEDGKEWGDWFSIGGIDTSYPLSESVREYDLTDGTVAFWCKSIGFNNFQARLVEPLEGDGSVQIGLACHAGV
jgi:hypothetical protein